ncbi:hypothetical protein K8Q93_03430 [Candidatus Parcubacteria bacterium]|nr:hypothetical protein [Candidatus Parcubacteria bacterium]
MIDQALDFLSSFWGFVSLVALGVAILAVVNWTYGNRTRMAFTIVALIVGYTLIIIGWQQWDTEYNKPILAVLILAAIAVALTLGLKKAFPPDQLKAWFKEYWGWFLIGIMPLLALVILFGADGLAIALSGPFLLAYAIIMILAVFLKWILVPWGIAAFLLGIWIFGGTPQGFLNGFVGNTTSVAKAIKADAKAGAAQASWIAQAMQPGMRPHEKAPPAYLVSTIPVETDRFQLFNNKSHGFKDLCKDKPCINPPNAPYWDGKVNQNNAQTAPAPAKTQTANLKPAEVPSLIVEPQSADVVSTSPLPRGRCVRAKSGYPDIWHAASNQRRELYKDWVEISMSGDTYPLLSENGKKATVEVAPCARS